MTKEIVTSLDTVIDEAENEFYLSVSFVLNKSKLKLLKELHGKVGIDEFLSELSEMFKEEIKCQVS